MSPRYYKCLTVNYLTYPLNNYLFAPLAATCFPHLTDEGTKVPEMLGHLLQVVQLGGCKAWINTEACFLSVSGDLGPVSLTSLDSKEKS